MSHSSKSFRSAVLQKTVKLLKTQVRSTTPTPYLIFIFYINYFSCCYHQISYDNQFKGGKVYFDSRFGVFSLLRRGRHDGRGTGNLQPSMLQYDEEAERHQARSGTGLALSESCIQWSISTSRPPVGGYSLPNSTSVVGHMLNISHSNHNIL